MKIISGNEFMLSMRDLAGFLGISPQAVHKIIKEGQIETSLIGNKLHISSGGVRTILTNKGYNYTKQTIHLPFTHQFLVKLWVAKQTTLIRLKKIL